MKGCLERITGEFGTQLRMNRSIQAEGSFANVKEDMNLRRYLYRGKENVLAQSTLLAIGFDINKLKVLLITDTCEEYQKIRGVYGIEKGLRPDDLII